MWSLILVAACGGPGPEPVQELVELYATDPVAATARLAGLPEEDRDRAVIAIVEHNPGQTQPLCALTSTRSAAARCRRFNERQHLWTIPPSSRSPPGGGGAVGERTGFPEAYRAPWLGQQADRAECGRAGAANLCLEERAVTAAREGRVADAAGACLAVPEGRLRQDCFFTAAESVGTSMDRYADGVALCAGAPGYAHECHTHLLSLLVGFVASTGTDEAIADLRSGVEHLSRVWRPVDAAFADRTLQQYLALATPAVLSGGTRFPLSVAERLPPAARPHVRSAIAARVAGTERPFEAAARIWAGESVEIPEAHGAHWAPVEACQTEGSTLDRQYFLDAQRTRPAHADPELDLQLAVAFALIQRRPPRLDLVEEAFDGLAAPVQAATGCLLRRRPPRWRAHPGGSSG